jgi:hypothetical protein
MQARHAMAGSSGKSNVQVCVDCTWSLLGGRAMMGLLASCTLVTGAPVVRKLFVAPEPKIAHLLIVSMLMLTVRRSAAVARAYWVGVRQEGNIFWFVGTLPNGYISTYPLPQVPTRQSVPTSRYCLPTYLGLPVLILTISVMDISMVVTYYLSS